MTLPHPKTTVLAAPVNALGFTQAQDQVLAKLRAASLADADVYTLEKMVAQFADGIARCLGW